MMTNESFVVPVPTSVKVKETSWKVVKIIYISIVLLLLYLPVFFMIILSFNSALVGNEFKGITFDWYLQMFSKKKLTSAILNTLSISILSTLISTIFGTIFAIGINSLSKKKRQGMILLNNLPILNADIVSGVFLFFVFKVIGNILQIRYPLGYVTLLLAHIFFSLPYVVLSVLPKLNEIDDNLFDAALDLGCKPRSALTKVIIPSIMGGVFSGAVLAFTMSIDDFTISYFVSGAKVQNLSIWIYSSSSNNRYGNMQSAYAFYSIFTVLLFIVMVGYNIISNKRSALRKGGNK
jgi:spermidine/putrescine transport system permease protein